MLSGEMSRSSPSLSSSGPCPHGAGHSRAVHSPGRAWVAAAVSPAEVHVSLHFRTPHLPAVLRPLRAYPHPRCPRRSGETRPVSFLCFLAPNSKSWLVGCLPRERFPFPKAVRFTLSPDLAELIEAFIVSTAPKGPLSLKPPLATHPLRICSPEYPYVGYLTLGTSPHPVLRILPLLLTSWVILVDWPGDKGLSFFFCSLLQLLVYLHVVLSIVLPFYGHSPIFLPSEVAILLSYLTDEKTEVYMTPGC